MSAAPNRRTAHHAAQELSAALNRVQAVRLRLEGKTLREIGEALGVHHSVVADYIKAELAAERALGVHEREQLREIELARLELVLARMMVLATRADIIIETTKQGPRGPVTITVESYAAATKAADMVVKISARIAALYGLDAPVKQEHSGSVAFEGVAAIRARIAARAGRPTAPG